MKRYDLIVIGSGSAMNLVEPITQENPAAKVAVIDKDEPGGICLTRGCIPSKILLYPAEVIRAAEQSRELGLEIEVKRVDFERVMARMRSLIDRDIDSIRDGLSSSKNIDYYHAAAEFVAPYTLAVQGETITSKMILLCVGSQPLIPPIEGLEEVGYLTSDTVLRLKTLPKSIAMVGGGYIAAEFGHFFAAMGSRVTVIGRNPRFLPGEEPEVSALAKRKLGEHMDILTNHEVRVAERVGTGMKRLHAYERTSGKVRRIEVEEVIVAAGRGPTTAILRPELGGIKTTEDGWIEVNEFLETSQPNVWALGDADGRHLFKHVANYESQVVYYNAVLKRRVKVDYHAVPHAVFTYPEVASVGLREKEALHSYGKDRIAIGFYRYEDTAKGEAMNIKGCFVKVIVERGVMRILGAHIFGPYASILIQEIINLMYTPDQSARPLMNSMHIHPAASEVVARAFSSLMEPDEYHRALERGLPS